MDPRVRPLASQHQARQLGRTTVTLGNHLVKAGSRPNGAAGSQRGSRQHVSGLGTVDVALEGVCVVQATDKCDPLTKIGDRGQHLAQFHRRTGTLGPEFARLEPVARKQDSQAGGSPAAIVVGPTCLLPGGLVVPPNRTRFHPRQRHRHATGSTQESSSRVSMSHRRGPFRSNCPRPFN